MPPERPLHNGEPFQYDKKRDRLSGLLTRVREKARDITPVPQNEMFPEYVVTGTTDWIRVKNRRRDVELQLNMVFCLTPGFHNGVAEEEVRMREVDERGEGRVLFDRSDLDMGRSPLGYRMQTLAQVTEGIRVLSLLDKALPDTKETAA